MNSCDAFFLVGPTAVGKTEVAHCLARSLRGEILSADSMLVYRGMDIGTAKPDAAMRCAVRYWGLDLAEPADRFSVGAYRREACTALRNMASRGVRAIVAGGTGLYVRALTEGLAERPAASEDLRARWEQVWREAGVDALARELRERRPDLYAALADPANPRRLIRALELAEAGAPAVERTWRSGSAAPELTGLRMPMSALTARIEARAGAMLENGLLEEARNLLDRGLAPGTTAWQAIGYAEALACLRGEFGPAEAGARIARRTRQLARRQMTWFRGQARVRWIDVAPSEDAEAVAARVREDWDRHGPVRIPLFECPA